MSSLKERVLFEMDAVDTVVRGVLPVVPALFKEHWRRRSEIDAVQKEFKNEFNNVLLINAIRSVMYHWANGRDLISPYMKAADLDEILSWNDSEESISFKEGFPDFLNSSIFDEVLSLAYAMESVFARLPAEITVIKKDTDSDSQIQRADLGLEQPEIPPGQEKSLTLDELEDYANTLEANLKYPWGRKLFFTGI